MPVLGLTMEEGTVAEWLKHEGDSVQKDEPLLTVEMDKGTVEVPSPASGVVRRIAVQPGTAVPVRTVIAEIGEAGVARRGADRQAVALGQRLFASPRARMRARAMGVDLNAISGSGPHGRIVEADVLAVGASDARVVATPLARRLADERGVSIGDLRGTGPGGRITQDDVLRAAEQRLPAAAVMPPAQVAMPPAPAEGKPAPAEIQPLTRLRRLTAERMAASARATARVSLFLEADFSEAARFRTQLQPEFERLGVAKLPWDAVIARAAALALLEHPRVADQWAEGEGIRKPTGIHVGVAVALDPEGLVVPVLRDADKRSLRELAAGLLALVDRARAGRLGPAEMEGGTFSITNLGAYRIDGFTPIVNSPETAIL